MILTWYGSDSATYRKGINQELCHRRKYLRGIYSLKASNLLSVQYGTTGMEKNEHRTCTVPSGLNPSRTRRSIPGIGPTLDAR